MPGTVTGGYSGHQAYEYLNIGGTYETPTWVRIARIEDIEMPDERGGSDLKCKGSDYVKHINGRRTTGVSFKYKAKKGADPVLDELKAAFESNDSNCVDYMALDGAADVSGSKGFRAPFTVMKLSESRPDEGPVVFDVELKLVDTEIPDGPTQGEDWEREAVTIA